MGSRLPNLEQKRSLFRNIEGKIMIFTLQSVVKISFLRCISHIHGGRILFDGQINNDLRDTARADDDRASELCLHTKICN